jgi:hypothetical protein
MRISFLVVAALGAALALPPAPCRANLLTNGSFESVPVATFVTVPAGGTAVTGWQVGGAAVDLYSEVVFQAPPLDPANRAFDGRQFIDLNGAPGPGMVSQVFPTVRDGLYEVTFAYSRNIAAPDISPVVPSGAFVSVFGARPSPLLQFFFESDLTGPSLVWTPVTQLFRADSDSATITFASVDPAGLFGGILIDGASVTLVGGTAVPEPGGLLLAAVGLGGLAVHFSRRRRK